MRPPDEIRREQTRRWLAKADQDFSLLCYLLDEETPYYSAVGFHAQQAAEKYLKALMTWRQIEFPKTHDLSRLLLLLADDAPLAENLAPIEILSPYGVDARYPDDVPELSREEAHAARTLAELARQVIIRHLPEHF